MTGPLLDSMMHLCMSIFRRKPFSIKYGTDIRFLCRPGTNNTPVRVTVPCTPREVADPIAASVKLHTVQLRAKFRASSLLIDKHAAHFVHYGKGKSLRQSIRLEAVCLFDVPAET